MARDYYAILSSVSAVMLGSLGLVLGYFYYVDQKKTHLKIQKREKQCRRLEAFILKIDQYDEYVHRILARAIENEKELNFIRNNISISFESIEVILEQGYDLLGITKEDAKAVIKVNSFVDKNELISQSSYDELLKSELFPVRSKYMELMRDVRITCYQRIT